MTNVVKLSALMMAAVLVTGCTNDALEKRVAANEAAIAKAQATADEANERSLRMLEKATKK